MKKQKFLTSPLLSLCFLLIIVAGCNIVSVVDDSDSADIPVLSTIEVTGITAETALSGGIITSDGGAAVLGSGLCWGASPNPTINDTKNVIDSISGPFTAYIFLLEPNTVYYARAYATNSAGTAYGNQISFTTLYDGAIGSFTDLRDGNVYQTVTIGSQVWLMENLRYLPEVMPPSNRSLTQPSYYVYGYDGVNVLEAKATENYNTYGVLYNWKAAMKACPDGWCLPDVSDWQTLVSHLAYSGYNYDGTIRGDRDKIAKAMSAKTHWNTDNTIGAIGNDLSMNNKSGFSALPAGYLFISSKFSGLGHHCHWWSSSQNDQPGYAWYFSLQYSSSMLYKAYFDMDMGFSVRCVKD